MTRIEELRQKWRLAKGEHARLSRELTARGDAWNEAQRAAKVADQRVQAAWDALVEALEFET